MIEVRDPAHIERVPDPDIRTVIAQRFEALSEYGPYDPEELGYFVLMEEGDSIDVLTAQIGFSVLENPFSDRHFGDPDFAPCAEVIEERPSYFDLVYVIGDAGFGVNLFVPKLPGIPDELLALCRTFAIPAPREALP